MITDSICGMSLTEKQGNLLTRSDTFAQIIIPNIFCFTRMKYGKWFAPFMDANLIRKVIIGRINREPTGAPVQ